MQNEIAELKAQVAELKAQVAANAALLQRIVDIPTIRLFLVGPDGGAVVATRFCAGNSDSERPDAIVNKPHPQDEAIRRNDKLRALSQELDRR